MGTIKNNWGMTKKKRIYRTVITITVLSEKPLIQSHNSMQNIIDGIDEGDYIGHTSFNDSQELVGKNAVNEITKLGSNPEFFQMDCNGNDIEEKSEFWY